MTDAQLVIRDATPADASAVAAIYAPYVSDTAITFETEVPTTAEMAGRIATAQHKHAWLVAAIEGRVVGYAYGGVWRGRAAFRWSCEVSVYLQTGLRRTGGGRALYEALFARLADRGYLVVVASMTEPNQASAGLHRALGFDFVGTHRRVGWKNGAWQDVTFMQATIAAGAEPPDEPT